MPMHPDERFMQALHGAARAWRGALDRHLKTRGLTAAGWNVLAALADSAEAPSQRELARRLGVDGATLVATIDRLADAGLVARMPGPHDRRIKLVVPTAKGRELSGQIRQETAALRSLSLERIDMQRIAAAAGVLEELRALLEQA